MSTLDPYQGVLLVSFGGPESADQVMPFLRSVTAGRGIPDERLTEVGRHYFDRGGVSPINAENRALRSALALELGRRGVDVPVFWGNRHLEPSLPTALRAAADHGAGRLVAVLTSAYPSYSGCRQYREDLASALACIPEGRRPVLDKVAPYAGHPGFLGTMTEQTRQATLAVRRRFGLAADRLALVFVTHSIPLTAAERSGPPDADGRYGHAYTRWHAEVARVVTARVSQSLADPAQAAAGGAHPTGALTIEPGQGRATPLRHALVYCSRSGPPGQPWLEPDIGEHLRELAADGVDGVVVVPIGFVSDHMEVVYDLDILAAGVAAELGLAFARVPTVRTHPWFVAGLADLLLHRARRARAPHGAVVPAAPGNSGEVSDRGGEPEGLWLPEECAVGCCPNPRGWRPAACGEDEPHGDHRAEGSRR